MGEFTCAGYQHFCLYIIDLQVYRQLVLSQLYLRQGEARGKKAAKKKETASLVSTNPLGIKNGFGGEFEETVKVNR